MFIHDSAIVDPGAVLGEGVKIWHFSHVMAGAVIGAGCKLGQNVFIDREVTLGRNVKVQNNVSVYRGVAVEDDVFIGPSVVFTNVKTPRSAHPTPVEKYHLTKIGKGASLGANSTIVCGVKIGPYAFVGAGSVVTKDVPPHALVYGNPARVRGWMCECGMTHETGRRRPKVNPCRRCGIASPAARKKTKKL